MYRYLYIMLFACGPAPQGHVRYPMVATGTPVVARQIGDWTVTLDVARLGFGPIYFCAAHSVRSCDTAAAEVTQVVDIDLLDTAEQELAQVQGLTGTIRSAAWDYGMTWLLTETAPQQRSPSGHSLVLHGTATRGTVTVPIDLSIDVPPLQQGAYAVLGSRATATVTDDAVRLEVHFDPAAWLIGVDFEDPAPEGPIIIGMTANAPPSFTWSPAR